MLLSTGQELVPLHYGAACARCDEQMEVAMDLAVKLLDRGADVSNPGRHVSIGGSGADAVKSDMQAVRATSLHSYPLMWATAAALRTDPGVRVDDALAVVKRMLVAGADPNAMNLQVSVRPKNTNGSSNTGGGGGGGGGGSLVRGRVLHIWDERALLLEVFDQSEWQHVMSLRMKLAEMLTEAGARSLFRPSDAMEVVASRATAADARLDETEKNLWGDGVVGLYRLNAVDTIACKAPGFNP